MEYHPVAPKKYVVQTSRIVHRSENPEGLARSRRTMTPSIKIKPGTARWLVSRPIVRSLNAPSDCLVTQIGGVGIAGP